MNPTQTPGGPTTGSAGVPPVQPSRPAEPVVRDAPDAAFGFADDTGPAPAPAPAPTPQIIQPQTQFTPIAPAPVVPPTPIVPAPAPQLPPQPPAAAPMPADVLPPQQLPAVPTLAPQPAPTPPTTDEPFDPAKVPVSASSTPVNPLASYSPTTGPHIPEDLAARITATPIQNSTDIAEKVHKGNASSRLKSVLSFFAFTAAIFLAAFLINQFIFQSYYVEGTSMTPTLQNNDRLIISKVERTLAAVQGKAYIPDRGQVVVLDSSIVGLNGQKEQLIKRVIGLPGDHIHIEGGTVVITNSQHPNGFDVTKDLGLTNLQATYVDAPIDLTVPKDQVFVMGDNREQGGSYDSRAFGPIDGNKIQGRLWGRILPLDHAQLF